jgi:hypothetical protein
MRDKPDAYTHRVSRVVFLTRSACVAPAASLDNMAFVEGGIIERACTEYGINSRLRVFSLHILLVIDIVHTLSL